VSLTPGVRLGPYELTAVIGEGGMGKVWRARHTALNRDDALKVLPDAFASDPDRLARFKREAQVLASLNHPNIARVYGLEQADGVQALVMELVEGPTLADRIAQGPIQVDEALPIAKQIAEALEAAHEQGIIHRDLKPANIKVRPDGTVKVLDFGLAKALEPAAVGSMDATAAPTITSPAIMTGVGVILGTAAYMSPEQARGNPADRRSDIWAFGCVLFEMLAGRRPFPDEETVSDTIAGILKGEPAWDALPADTPQKIRALLERCLRKDVRRRLPHIGEARIEIEEAGSEPAPAAESDAPALRRGTYLWRAVAAVALLAAAALAGWAILAPPVPEQPVARFEVTAPPGAIPFGNLGRTMEIGDPLSPDGRAVAFHATVGGRQMIWVRQLDASTPKPIPGTEDAVRAIWSPDSRYIAFFLKDQLKKVAVAGGPSMVICNEGSRDLAWNSQNVILIGGQGKSLLRVSASGGQPTPATELLSAETSHDYPQFLPDDRHFLYMARRGPNPEDWDAYVGSLDSKERRLLEGVHAAARYSPTGHLLFLRGQALMAQPFDLDRLALTGDAFPVADGVAAGPRPLFSISANGTLAYLTAASNMDSQLAWIDRAGGPLTPFGPRGNYNRIDLSHDDRYVAFDRGLDILLLDIERGLTSNFVTRAGADFAAVFSADGSTIAFASSREPATNAGAANPNAGNLYVRAVGAVEEERVLLRTNAGKTPTDWSRDGYLAYTSRNDVWALPAVSGSAQPLQVTNTPFVESGGRFSPDGRWIAYQSNDSATGQDVYIQSFPDGRRRYPVSAGGGAVPRWSKDGKELFYVAPDLTLMAVTLKPVGSDLEFGKPVRLFQSRAFQGNREYDVSTDGRFLLNDPFNERTDTSIAVIVNWAAGLKK
jgi:eukaryotic-like serine/threonine-protein kinase